VTEPRPPQSVVISVMDDPDSALGDIEARISDPYFGALLDQAGCPPRTGALADRLQTQEDFVAAAWDFRHRQNGRSVERNQLVESAVAPAYAGSILPAARSLGMLEAVAPRYCAYDHLLIMGGLVRSTLWRARYAAALLGDGVVEADEVVALSCRRPLAANRDDPRRDEYALLRAYGLPPLRYECEVAAWAVAEGFQLDPAEHRHPALAAPSRPDPVEQPVASLICVPQPAGTASARVDTAGALRFWANARRPRAGERVLIVTTCPYVPYQHATALRCLALEYALEIDTVGVDHALVDPGPVPARHSSLEYLQEIRSVTNAYLALVQALG
jgi:hypothetical protein